MIMSKLNDISTINKLPKRETKRTKLRISLLCQNECKIDHFYIKEVWAKQKNEIKKGESLVNPLKTYFNSTKEKKRYRII